MSARVRAAAVVVALVISLVPAATAQAAGISVTTTADAIDAAANCPSVTLASLPGPDSQTSLREAVCAANTNSGPDTISFAVNGTFVLTGAPNEDNGQSGDLDIKGSLAVSGNGATNTIIDGGGSERIFDVFPSFAITFDLDALTLQNGDTRLTSFKEGGAIYLHNNVTSTISNSRIANTFSGGNGAIENRGTLTISDSVLTGNQTIPASGEGRGGGIHNAGTLLITRSTISNNSVRGEGGGIATGTGAAIEVTIANSTISNNTASVTGGASGNGGGISTTGNQGTIEITNSTISGNHADNHGGGAWWSTAAGGTGNATLTNVTVTNNTADQDNDVAGQGGGFAQSTAAVTLRNTIVAGNFNSTASVRDDISGSVISSSSFNLIGDGTGSTGLVDGVNSNQVGAGATPIDPLLGPLTNNLGPTETHALQSASPAIDAANNATCPAFDQRGISRPIGPTCDIGAFEASLTPSVVINQASGQADPTSTSPIHFTAVFSRPVSGFATGDVSLSGTAGATSAVVSEIAPNNGTTYDVAVTGMTGNGTVIATIQANVAEGNTASTSTDNTVTFLANNAPVANDDNAMTDEDTPVDINVLTNDTDADGDPLTVSSVTQPTHGTAAINADNSVRYTPASGFSGPDSFEYTISDGAGGSDTGLVNVTVNAADDSPTVAVAPGGSCSASGVGGIVNLVLADPDTPLGSLTLSGSSSNTLVVRNADVVFGGSGANRTVTITAQAVRAGGTATITVTVSDGTGTGSTTVLVIVGTSQADTLTGSAGPDLILGLSATDTINAGDGIDLLCGDKADDTLNGGSGADSLDGGKGNDMLTGGPGPDAFSGGAGTDTATDFNAGQGDTQDGTVP
jgi:Ca2+-binding RTX toxin-like protein